MKKKSYVFLCVFQEKSEIFSRPVPEPGDNFQIEFPCRGKIAFREKKFKAWKQSPHNNGIRRD